jgi:drug/metabolite transporter (DMT)-like permease
MRACIRSSSNLSPLFTLIIAIPFLGERLTEMQYVGIGILIVSGAIAALPHLRKNNRDIIQGLLFCLLSTALLGFGTAYERFMLDRIDFGAYLVLGWGSQVVWMALLAGREWKLLPELIHSIGARTLFTYGFVNGLKSACFILTLLLTSASLLSGASDFMPIGIIVGAYFFLNEREHLWRKSIATVIGIVGLILLTV